jgi:hypothetical protein
MKKILNYISVIAIFCGVLAISSCTEYQDGPPEYISQYDYISLRNRSSHTIRCTDGVSSWELQTFQIQEKRVNLPSGAKLIFHYTEGMELGATDEILFNGTTKVVFDNKYEITHTEDMTHSLLNESSYELYNRYYTYMFTDADYEYAVANGVVIGE